jgi:hypothetical protein
MESLEPMKPGDDPAAVSATMPAAYDVRPAEFHAYISVRAAACDPCTPRPTERAGGRMPDDPDGFGACSTIPATSCRLRMSSGAAARGGSWP